MSQSFNKVLFVEDNPIDARLIERTLARSGKLELHHVTSLQAALRELETQHFDAVLLDLMLPDSQGGIETMRALHEVNGEIAVIVLTGMEDTELGLAAVREGAQDYMVKEHCSRENLLRVLGYAIERVRHAADERALREAEHQLDVAGKIQQARVPRCAPQIDGYDVAGLSWPAAVTGGDYFDYLPFREPYTGVAVGDASGHGLGPAMVMSDVRAILRTLTTIYADVGEILRLLNTITYRDLGVSMFMTLLVVRIEPGSGKLQYAGAGHSGLLLDHQGELRARLTSDVPPLNVLPNLGSTKTTTAELRPGEALLLYTDGVTESRTSSGELFGEERLLQIARRDYQLSARELVARIIHSASEFSAPAPREDDMTAVVIRRK